MMFTRTPWGPNSSARDLPSAVSAALAELMATGKPPGIRATVDEMLTIAPRRSIRLGRAARVARTVLSTLMSNMLVHSLSSTSRKPSVASSPPPTLFTSRSMPPSSARALSMRAETPSAVLRSADTAYAPVSLSSGVMVRAAPTTRTPSSIRVRTVASPMPRLAPVTTAVLVVRLRFTALQFLIKDRVDERSGRPSAVPSELGKQGEGANGSVPPVHYQGTAGPLRWPHALPASAQRGASRDPAAIDPGHRDRDVGGHAGQRDHAQRAEPPRRAGQVGHRALLRVPRGGPARRPRCRPAPVGHRDLHATVRRHQ